MLAIELPNEIEARLDRLARKTGRTKDDYIREALLECLDDWEDVALSEDESIEETLEVLGDDELMTAIRRARQEEERGQGIPWVEAKKRMGL
jgi:predicted DNA-binding protein